MAKLPSNRTVLLWIAAMSVATAALATAGASGPEILAAALRHHDPGAVWSTGHFRLTLESKRPDGTVRRRVLELDNARGVFKATWSEPEGPVDVAIGPGDACDIVLDSEADITADRQEELGLDCDRWRRLRDYYLYMWGLPMKLRDAGTQVGEGAGSEDFNGESAQVVSVTYAPEVGEDVWYFYFSSGRAVGYRFYHDPSANDGEYIVLEGEVEAGGVRFPQRQSWYMNDDDEYLGSDELVAAERLD